jgi:hypothetical protein
MTEFPPGTNVSLPTGMLLDGVQRVALRLDAGSPIEPLLESLEGRLAWVEADLAELDGTRLAALGGRRVRVRVASTELERVAAHVDGLHRAQTVCLLAPSPELMRTVNFLAAMHLPVHVQAACPCTSATELERVCDFYLHSPTLRVPVEPLHTLLLATAQGGGWSLWETEFEDVGCNVFVSPSGKVTLGERWAERELFYGSLEDDWLTIAGSPLHSELREFRERLFRRKSPCVLCPHMAVCGGFLRAIDSTANCEPWKRVFDKLRQACGQAEEVLAHTEAPCP